MSDLEQAFKLLRDSVKSGFYGEVSFTVRDGHIALMKRTETHIPTQPENTERTSNNGHQQKFTRK